MWHNLNQPRRRQALHDQLFSQPQKHMYNVLSNSIVSFYLFLLRGENAPCAVSRLLLHGSCVCQYRLKSTVPPDPTLWKFWWYILHSRYLLILNITPKQIVENGLRISYLTEAWEWWKSVLENLTNIRDSSNHVVCGMWLFLASVLVLNGAI